MNVETKAELRERLAKTERLFDDAIYGMGAAGAPVDGCMTSGYLSTCFSLS